MDLEKLTDRARGFLQAAQTIAVREHHQRIAPAHLLKALLDDEQGMAAGLIQAAGGDPKAAKREVDMAVSKIPSVTGSGATQAPALDGDTIRILDQAEQVAQKSGDSYVTVERILLAMALAEGYRRRHRALRRRADAARPQRRDRQIARRADGRHARRRGPLRRAQEICRATSPRRRARASSTRSSAATRKSAARSRCSPAAPRTIRC